MKKSPNEDVINLLISRLESFDRNINNLDAKVDELVVITAKQEENVKEHMRRSDALERRQDSLEIKNTQSMNNISQRIEPIESHVKWLGITLKIIGVLGAASVTVFAIIEGYLKIVQYMK